jgi:hypothetical protein
MRRTTILAALVLTATLPVSTHAVEPIRLFNGRDLTGWTFDLKGDTAPAETWSVQDGVLTCTGRPAGVLRTAETYANYELTVEWRWAEEGKGGNSGVLIHTSTPRQLDIWPKSLEVQLASGNAGDFWMIGETIQVPAERTPKEGRRILNLTDHSERPVGEWNTLRIQCNGAEVTVWINGDKVNEGTACSASKGAICLQSEGAPIQFRRVELKPL